MSQKILQLIQEILLLDPQAKLSSGNVSSLETRLESVLDKLRSRTIQPRRKSSLARRVSSTRSSSSDDALFFTFSNGKERTPFLFYVDGETFQFESRQVLASLLTQVEGVKYFPNVARTSTNFIIVPENNVEASSSAKKRAKPNATTLTLVDFISRFNTKQQRQWYNIVNKFAQSL